jgi:hypothetical protein
VAVYFLYSSNLVLLYKVGRDIPALHGEHAFGGFVYSFESGPVEIEQLSAQLKNVKDAKAARTILAR